MSTRPFHNAMIACGIVIILMLPILGGTYYVISRGLNAKRFRAESFEIVDKRGNLRGEFGMNSEGDAQFVLRDERAVPRVIIDVDRERTTLYLTDRLVSGSFSAVLSTRAGPFVSLTDQSEEGTVMMGVVPGNGSALTLRDRDGKTRQLSSSADTLLAKAQPTKLRTTR